METKHYRIPFLIAEVGCNHKGNMEIAHQFIRIAANFCGVDAVKFQKRNNIELLTPEEYNHPHPNPDNSYGETYGIHREFLELSIEQHAQLKAWCDEYGVIYSSSVWDLTSAKEITALNPEFIKVPSACNNNYIMLNWLCENYSGDIHVSLGMTKREEEKELINLFVDHNRNESLVLYSCTSGYPVDFKDICLFELSRLSQDYGALVKQIGFSGHHLGIAVDIAAYTLGASVIERHFTLDRTWKGTDHAASLEPEGLRKLKRDLVNTQRALTYKEIEILPIENEQRVKLKYKARDNK